MRLSWKCPTCGQLLIWPGSRRRAQQYMNLIGRATAAKLQGAIEAAFAAFREALR